MPLYEYACPNCKLEFELIRSMKQSDEGVACPRCGERLPSLFCKGPQGATSSVMGACSSCSASSCRPCR